MQPAIDEAIADALMLASGDSAQIRLVAERAIDRSGDAWRIDVPWVQAPTATEVAAIVVDGNHYLVVIPDGRLQGDATLQLRPANGASRTIDLREPAGALFLIPLAGAGELAALAAGAIEFEAQRSDGRVWATLPLPARSTRWMAALPR